MSKNDGTAIWHTRLGHLSMDKLRAMVSKSLVSGLPNVSSFVCGDVCEGH